MGRWAPEFTSKSKWLSPWFQASLLRWYHNSLTHQDLWALASCSIGPQPVSLENSVFFLHMISHLHSIILQQMSLILQVLLSVEQEIHKMTYILEKQFFGNMHSIKFTFYPFCKWNHTASSFCDFFPYYIMSARFIHFVAFVRIPFLLKAG